jgi:hypothetical protein
VTAFRCGVPVFLLCFISPFPHSLVRGGLVPRDLRTAHCRGRRIFYVAVDRPRAGYRIVRPHIPWGWMVLSRESNKKNVITSSAISCLDVLAFTTAPIFCRNRLIASDFWSVKSHCHAKKAPPRPGILL